MAVQNVPLIQAQQIAGAATLYFTAAASTRIDAFTFYNPVGNAACVVAVSIVPSGQTPSTATLITRHNMLPDETFNAYGIIGQTLNAGDMIYVAAATAGLVNLFASGLVSS